jgi:hypothetical protein
LRAEHCERALDAFDGSIAAAIHRAVREIEQAAGESRIASDQLRKLPPRGVAVIGGAQQLRQECRPPRRVLRISGRRM